MRNSVHLHLLSTMYAGTGLGKDTGSYGFLTDNYTSQHFKAAGKTQTSPEFLWIQFINKNSSHKERRVRLSLGSGKSGINQSGAVE